MTITEGRRTELKQGLSNWTQAGGHAYLATFTNSHHRGDGLDGLIQGQKRLLRSFGKKPVQLKTLKSMVIKVAQLLPKSPGARKTAGIPTIT